MMETKSTNMETKFTNNVSGGGGRLEYLDFLRAGAAVAVLFYHCGAAGLPQQLISVFFNWCVPMFLLISGALFLRADKATTERRMLRKYVPKVLMILLFWGFVYNVISTVIIERTISLGILWKAVQMVLTADTAYCYQFWYLYVLVGLYLFLPVIKPWTDKMMSGDRPGTECKAVFGIFFALSIVLSTCLKICRFEGIFWKDAFTIFSGYVFYLLCGQWLWKWGLPKKVRVVLWVVFAAHAIGFLVCIGAGCFDRAETWYGYTSLFTWTMSVLLFDTVRRIDPQKVGAGVKKVILSISRHSLGIYILHVMVGQFLRKVFGFESSLMNAWVFPIVAVAVVLILCWTATIVIKKTPVLKRLV